MRRLLVCLLVMLIIVPISAQGTQTDFDDLLANYAATDGPAVVIQITTPDSTQTTTIGLADGERPTTPDDRFRIGSMSKTYVATVTLMLVEDGVFALDDRASHWLPDDVVANIANADVVTIRQLLAMRSGIPDYLDFDFWRAIQKDFSYEWTAPEVLTYAYDTPALFEPDVQYSYSNTNYVLMQLILEKATGMSLAELIREKILDPLNLKNTYTQISETHPKGFVNGYVDIDGDGKLDDVTNINDGAGLGDGGLVSNTADITTFYRALLQEQTLLSEQMMAELLNFRDDGEGGGYSLGLAEWETEYGTAWGHSGAVIGFLSFGIYLPDENIIVIALSADMTVDIETLVNDALSLVIGE
jgi:D-alanyl-D-alanine carboxypeptidase